MVYDFEPHSIDTKKKISAAIENGLKVVIAPDNIEEKDINDLIMKNYSNDHLQWILENNVYEGLKAKIRLIEWSKR
jgi:hypothetical protein